MEFSQIKELIQLVNTTGINELNLSIEGMTLYLNKTSVASHKQENTVMPAITQATVVQQNNEQPVTVLPPVVQQAGHLVKAPLVGTFYRSQAPDKPPFVEVGQKVKQGDVLCIVEAMKIMNEITSEVAGEVAEIMASNDVLVEYGQPLIRIV